MQSVCPCMKHICHVKGKNVSDIFNKQNLIRFNFDVIIFKHRVCLKTLEHPFSYICVQFACIEAGFSEHYVCDFFFSPLHFLFAFLHFSYNNHVLWNGARRWPMRVDSCVFFFYLFLKINILWCHFSTDYVKRSTLNYERWWRSLARALKI